MYDVLPLQIKKESVSSVDQQTNIAQHLLNLSTGNGERLTVLADIVKLWQLPGIIIEVAREFVIRRHY